MNELCQTLFHIATAIF